MKMLLQALFNYQKVFYNIFNGTQIFKIFMIHADLVNRFEDKTVLSEKIMRSTESEL